MTGFVILNSVSEGSRGGEWTHSHTLTALICEGFRRNIRKILSLYPYASINQMQLDSRLGVGVGVRLHSVKRERFSHEGGDEN